MVVSVRIWSQILSGLAELRTTWTSITVDTHIVNKEVRSIASWLASQLRSFDEVLFGRGVFRVAICLHEAKGHRQKSPQCRLTNAGPHYARRQEPTALYRLRRPLPGIG